MVPDGHARSAACVEHRPGLRRRPGRGWRSASLGERDVQLQLAALPGPPAVPDPVRPGQQHRAAASPTAPRPAGSRRGRPSPPRSARAGRRRAGRPPAGRRRRSAATSVGSVAGQECSLAWASAHHTGHSPSGSCCSGSRRDPDEAGGEAGQVVRCDQLGEPASSGRPTRRAPARARSSRYGRTQGQTPCTSRRKTAAPGRADALDLLDQLRRPVDVPARLVAETAEVAAVPVEHEGRHLPQLRGRPLVVAAVAAAAEGGDHARPARVAHALRRRPAGREQLAPRWRRRCRHRSGPRAAARARAAGTAVRARRRARMPASSANVVPYRSRTAAAMSSAERSMRRCLPAGRVRRRWPRHLWTEGSLSTGALTCGFLVAPGRLVFAHTFDRSR